MTVGLMGIALLLVLLALGVPIAFSLGLVGALGIVLIRGAETGIQYLATQPYSLTAQWPFVIVPLFILMGHLAFASGVSRDAYQMFHKWLGGIPGGLAVATVMGCAAFAATSGSSVATAATMGKVAIPEMRRFKYDMKFVTGCVAAGGLLGIMIPPSGILVLYGIITEVSIGKLLIAGFLPGIFNALVYCVGIYWMVKRKPSIAPPAPAATWAERFSALRGGLGVLILFGVVIGGMYVGVFTPTEAAAFGCAVAFVMLILRTRKPLPELRVGLADAARTSAMIFAIILGAGLFGLFLTLTGIPQQVSAFLVTLPLPRIVILILIMLPFLPLGCLLDSVSILFLTLPVLYPAVKALGFDGVWFGILVTQLIEIGLLTPPVGLNVFVVKGIVPDVSLEDVFRGMVPFLWMQFLVLAVILAFPDLALFLPRLTYR